MDIVPKQTRDKVEMSTSSAADVGDYKVGNSAKARTNQLGFYCNVITRAKNPHDFICLKFKRKISTIYWL